MERNWHHIAAVRGTIQTVFSLTEQYVLELSELVPEGTAIAPITQIRVNDVEVEIPSGKELRFQSEPNSCTSFYLTTNGITPVGSQIIQIQPYIGRKIPCHYLADIGPVDYTGRIYRAQVRASSEATIELINLTCIVNALAGSLQIICATTGLETANATFTQLPQDALELQQITDVDANGKLIQPQYNKIIKNAYFWDCEYSLAGRIISEQVGLFWLIAEATK